MASPPWILMFFIKSVIYKEKNSYLCGHKRNDNREDMKVSVIIPIYNVECYLEECIKSVAAQTFHDYEIIAVDDCSKDFSMEVLDACIESCGFPKERITIVHHHHNRGLSAARNTGVQASKAEFVYFMDSDDTILPDCLEKMMKASTWQEQAVDMVVGNYRFDGPNIGCPRLSVGKQFLNQKEYIQEYCEEHIYPMAWNRLLRRDFLLQNQLFFEEGLIHEDTLWNFQMLQYVNRVGIVEDDTYVYRIRQNSIQSSDNFEQHFKANSYIVGRLADIMFGCFLKYNQYVYNFVEQEKLRHLYDCYRSGNMHLVRDLYTICRKKPHYHPWVAWLLFGYNRKIRKNILKRDYHYSKPFEIGLKIFSNLPNTL